MEEKLEGASEIVDNIIENYTKMEESIVNQLGLYYKLHSLNTGISREDIWLQLFQMIIPKKFVIEHSIFIIDSDGHVSREVDLAIVDNTYTPYIFQYGKLKFIPIEAVAAVVECKSSSVNVSSVDKEQQGKSEEKEENKEEKKGKHVSTLEEWCDSIKKLHTSQESIVRMAAGTVIDGILKNGSPLRPSSQTSTRPIRIFCGYETEVSAERLLELFDFVLIVKKGKLKVHAKPNDLQEWQKELNHYESKAEEQESCKDLAEYGLEEYKVEKDGETVTLLTFNFQLNQLLMLINNPILFPHRAYVRLFNHKHKES